MNYSNQETSVTIGESVRDEDGAYFSLLSYLVISSKKYAYTTLSLYRPVYRPRRGQ